MSPAEIYNKLGFKDPDLFKLFAQKKQLNEHGNTFYEPFQLREFVQERRTGKTTRRLVEAISHVLSGQNARYISSSTSISNVHYSIAKQMLNVLGIAYLEEIPDGYIDSMRKILKINNGGRLWFYSKIYEDKINERGLIIKDLDF